MGEVETYIRCGVIWRVRGTRIRGDRLGTQGRSLRLITFAQDKPFDELRECPSINSGRAIRLITFAQDIGGERDG